MASAVRSVCKPVTTCTHMGHYQKAGEAAGSAKVCRHGKRRKKANTAFAVFIANHRVADPALQWHNANGGDLYLYPGLLVVFQNADQFALLT